MDPITFVTASSRRKSSLLEVPTTLQKITKKGQSGYDNIVLDYFSIC
jgi:hypothetical protein